MMMMMMMMKTGDDDDEDWREQTHNHNTKDQITLKESQSVWPRVHSSYTFASTGKLAQLQPH